ncbi:hypothetical protein KY290_016577 [Solanum tuberosum]|uniref:DNA2/NAM7 helicase helicase domain-containing protein n=1 Tax=Solanum tuberosum TaxID=4113 RepID=A0ABQ7V8U4_SOLTU|nr:hypothetical protein KY290_016577 [Solanum tuberosum]
MEGKKVERKYKPVNGDLIALSDVLPRRIDDLNRRKISYLIGIDEVDCSLCSSTESKTNALSNSSAIIQSFGLDGAQQEVVLSCIATKECVCQSTIKLIWGPPGTGKTKTVASLLYVLLKMKCRTLTCAPTNIVVLGVTKRLMQHVRDGLEFDTYGLGDIILPFGSVPIW